MIVIKSNHCIFANFISIGFWFGFFYLYFCVSDSYFIFTVILLIVYRFWFCSFWFVPDLEPTTFWSSVFAIFSRFPLIDMSCLNFRKLEILLILLLISFRFYVISESLVIIFLLLKFSSFTVFLIVLCLLICTFCFKFFAINVLFYLCFIKYLYSALTDIPIFKMSNAAYKSTNARNMFLYLFKLCLL